MLLLLAAVGCPGGDDGTASSAGSSTGGTGGSSGTTMIDQTASATDIGTGSWTCVETPTVITLDEPSPLGFSAAELLAGKLGPRTTTLVFDDFGGIAAAYRGQTLALDVELRHAGDEVRWVDVDSGGDPACVDRIEVDVELDFMTAGGAFAESRAAVLVASAVDTATLEVQLLPALMGSLDPATLYENGWAVTGLSLTGTWSQELAGGRLWSETKDGDFGGRFTLATWGDTIAP